MTSTNLDEKHAPSVKNDHVEDNGVAEQQNHISISDPKLDASEAFKGDDSDGRIEWTRKQVAATISLSGLYVGMFGLRWTTLLALTLYRIADTSLFRWCIFDIHLCRHWW